tara:strand:- start:1023 stop:3062 length:2040 start_codon:yes stop_codon:yes gene_type:complete
MGINNRISVIIQARCKSSRFAAKVLSKIKNKTLLEILVNRIKKAKNIDQIIVACTKSTEDDKIIKVCKKLNIKFYRGSNLNVLSRYYFCAKAFNLENIVRLTADCPLIDPNVLDNFASFYKNNNYDYVSNTIDPTYPDGMDIEIFNFQAIKERHISKKIENEHEHVTTGIIKLKKYKKFNFSLKKDYSNLKLSVDTKYDLLILNKLIKFKNFNFNLTLKKILELYDQDKNFFQNNSNVIRNEGMHMNLGQKFWIRANEVIANGSMLFSKNPDLHLPGLWPAYFSKAKGCNIWDLENNQFKDIFLMGVGTNTLGYAYQPIEKKIRENLKKSNMSSLNSIDEILLAEKLIDIHPWADMARFTRSGGEANAVAIRIARACSGKSNIAICGYHGWHDWYLSPNLRNKKNLNNHLINNLNIEGVPKNLKNTVFPFNYNDISGLRRIIDAKNIGVVKMEVERNQPPKMNFLKKVRDICTKKNIILIFDECTSGFRSNFGGLHLKYKINPDIAIFGKALGNGYAINAIIGKKEIMESVKKTFISSTFWTERMGSVAGLETLKCMEKLKSWTIISKTGKKIKSNWNKIANNNSIKINIHGLDALPNFNFKSNNHNLYKTYISQEMIEKKIIASNTIYTSISHTDKIMDNYFNLLDNIFRNIKKCEDQKESIYKLLKTKSALKGIRGK